MQRPVEELVVELRLVPDSVLEAIASARAMSTSEAPNDFQSMHDSAAALPDQPPTTVLPSEAPVVPDARVAPEHEPFLSLPDSTLHEQNGGAFHTGPVDHSPAAPSMTVPAEPRHVEPFTAVAAPPAMPPDVEAQEAGFKGAEESGLAFDVVVRVHGGEEMATATYRTRGAAEAEAERLVLSADDHGGPWLETGSWWIRREAAFAVGIRPRLVVSD
jgi:hypothetical protein